MKNSVALSIIAAIAANITTANIITFPASITTFIANITANVVNITTLIANITTFIANITAANISTFIPFTATIANITTLSSVSFENNKLMKSLVKRGLTWANLGGGGCHGDSPVLLRPRPSQTVGQVTVKGRGQRSHPIMNPLKERHIPSAQTCYPLSC